MQTRQTPYQIKCSRRKHSPHSVCFMLCHRLARYPRTTRKALSVSIATMSTTAEPARKAMPSALTFDRHAKCSVCSLLYSVKLHWHRSNSSFNGSPIDNQSPCQYPPPPPWLSPSADLHARRDTGIAQRPDIRPAPRYRMHALFK
jgi:hypothetical protein